VKDAMQRTYKQLIAEFFTMGARAFFFYTEWCALVQHPRRGWGVVKRTKAQVDVGSRQQKNKYGGYIIQ